MSLQSLEVTGKVLRGSTLLDISTGHAKIASAPPPSSRFAGDPGLGLVYVGGHEETPDWPVGQTTIATRYSESTLGPIGVVRRFYQDYDSWGTLASDLAADKAAGRWSWVSCKPGGTFYNRTTLQKDTRYGYMVDFFTTLENADHNIIATTFHEPENDDGTTQHYVDWGELQQQWANARDEVGAPKVVTASVLMSYTFRTISGRPYASWVAASEPNDIQGIDYYAYATNPSANQVLVSAPLDDVMNRTDSRPLSFAEIGQTRVNGLTAWQNAMSDFYDVAAEESWPFMCYFDSGYNSVEDWPLTSDELTYYNTIRQRSYATTL